jgi:hypothetical protein
MQEKLVVEIGRLLSRKEFAGDICLRRPKSTQGCRVEDNDDYNDDDDYNASMGVCARKV